MSRLFSIAAAFVLMSACSEGRTAQEAEEQKGQIGASSGPNPNLGGAATGDAFGEPTPSDPRGVAANSARETERGAAPSSEPSH